MTLRELQQFLLRINSLKSLPEDCHDDECGAKVRDHSLRVLLQLDVQSARGKSSCGDVLEHAGVFGLSHSCQERLFPHGTSAQLKHTLTVVKPHCALLLTKVSSQDLRILKPVSDISTRQLTLCMSACHPVSKLPLRKRNLKISVRDLLMAACL